MLVLKDAEVALSEVGVYVLIRNEVPVYVGMTTGRTSRIAQHVSDPNKVFDTFQFIPCPGDVARSVERALIALLRPNMNKTMPSLPIEPAEHRSAPAEEVQAFALTPIEKETNRIDGLPRVAAYSGTSVGMVRQAILSGELSVARVGSRGIPHAFAISEIDRWRASFIAGLKIEVEPC